MSTIVDTLHTLNSTSVDLSWQIKYCSKLHQSNVLRVAKYQGPGSQPQDWSDCRWDCGWNLRLWVRRWMWEKVVDAIEWKFSHWILSVPLPLKREDLIKTRPMDWLIRILPKKVSIATYSCMFGKVCGCGCKNFLKYKYTNTFGMYGIM